MLLHKRVPAESAGAKETHGYFCMQQETQKVGYGKAENLTVTFQRRWLMQMHTLQQLCSG